MSKLITFEGIIGAGLKTQQVLLGAHLTEHGIPHITTREPGGTEVGEKVRSFLLYRGCLGFTPLNELNLIDLARRRHVTELIEPTLEAGVSVISHRYIHSTLVYQGELGGMPTEEVYTRTLESASGLLPDLTLVLDVDDVGAAVERARESTRQAFREDLMRRDKDFVQEVLQRDLSFFEQTDHFRSQGVDYHRSARDAYRALVHASNGSTVLIPEGTPEGTHEIIKPYIDSVFQ